jgi:Tfp pilus assembly protein PilV
MSPTPSPATSPPKRRGSEAGFTIIEVLVSALMVILIGTATAKALITTAHVSGDQRLRAQADAVATQDQERLRGLSDEQLNGLSQTRPVTVGTGQTFSVKSVATFVDTTGASSCTSGAASNYKIASNVSWAESFSKQSTTITEESLLTRPVTGDMITQVNDETGHPVPGVTVTASGPSIQSGATDANGCVTFAGLTPGSYAVALAAPGYVDVNGNASPPNMTATVTSTGSAVAPSGGNPAFAMGQEGSIAGTFTNSTMGVGGEADSIAWFGSLGTLSMSAYQSTLAPTDPVTTPTSAITTDVLFPFYTSTPAASYANNYTLWAGRCLQQEPPAGIDQYTVKPGITNLAQNVQEPVLDLANVNYKNGTTAAVKPDHVRLTFTSSNGTACSYTWYPSITSAVATAEPATGWLAKPGQPFASSATSGATMSNSHQTGSLTVCADYNGYKSATALAFTNTSFTAMNLVPTLLITQGTNAGKC